MSFSWGPQPGPQTEAICADWCPEVFYGGAAGGGKSDFLLGDFLQDVPTYGQAWKGILFRRTYPELEELMARAHEIYPTSGGGWNEQKKTWTWPNGANLKMRFLEADRDATRYQGHQYTWVGWDELTQWPTLFPYRYLRARLRSAHNVPTKRIRSAANPGGLGHMAVKQYFIDPAPGGFVPIKDPDTGLERMFIPSRIRDNAVLLRNDPDYVARLKGLGSDAMVKAWLEGDWNVVDGAFFDCWNSAKHVVSPFGIPDNWLRFRSFDWGSARPFSVGWWAVVTDDYRTRDGHLLPRGALVRYREWYGAKGPNEGLKLTAEEVAEGIIQREFGDTIAYGVADPSIFTQNGGPSIAERMMPAKCYWRPADNRRVGQNGAQGGWDQMRERLKGDDGLPMLYVFNTCKDFIRTVPALQHDANRPEDIDTDGEDHCFAGDTLVSTDKGSYTFVELLGTSGLVRSDDGGWHPYRNVRLIGKNKPVVRLGFSDGSEVTCTPDHLFLTTLGWIEARNLLGKRILSLNPRPNKPLVAAHITNAAPISKLTAKGFTELCGQHLTGLFRPVSMSITGMAIHPTMTLITLNAFPAESIWGEGMAKHPGKGRGCISSALEQRPLSGINPKPEGHGIKSTTAWFARLLSIAKIRLCASSAEMGLRLHRVGSAPTSAKQHGGAPAGWMTKAGLALSALRRSMSTNTLASAPALESAAVKQAAPLGLVCLSLCDVGNADVYCLTVPETGNFALANGAIVANCGDEARYACMSRPWIKPKPDQRKTTPQLYGTADGAIKSGATMDELWKTSKRPGNTRI